MTRASARMRGLQRLILVVAVAGFAVLLWTVDARTVGRLVARVGWGLALIVAQEIVAHVANTAAWRFAFTPEHASRFTFLELLRLRIIGDAINYVTPSGTLAGEVTRATMLNPAETATVRAGGVIVAKAAQTLGQVLFAVVGLTIVAARRHVIAEGYQLVLDAVALVLLGTVAWFVVRRLLTARVVSVRTPPAVPATTRLGALRQSLRAFFLAHPGRFAAATGLFVLGYAWGTVEAYLICVFLGARVSVATALTIEIMSVAIDTLFFMVPAKIGTQEGGKTVIFSALGLPATLGFAFGVIRHVRELVWAAFGLVLHSISSRGRAVPGRVGA